MEIILMSFPKNYCLEQMGHLGPRMAHPHNSGSAVSIVLQFFERGQERHENYFNGFSEKNFIEGNSIILVQKWYFVITLDLLSGFFLILHNKKGQEVHENFIS